MTTITDAATSPLASLATELQRQLATKRDLVADTRRVSFTDADPEWLRGAKEEEGHGTTLLVDLPDAAPESYAVTRYAHTQIADHLGVPWKLYDRLHGAHPDLLFGLANGLLSREPAKRMLRTVDGKVRAFLSDRYRPRDNWDLLEEAILPELGRYGGNVVFKQASLTETRMYVKIVLPDIEKPIVPKVGDVIRGGVIIQNSEVGAGALGIYPYTDRLVCANGMVHTDFGQRRLHVGRRTTGGERGVGVLLRRDAPPRRPGVLREVPRHAAGGPRRVRVRRDRAADA